MPSPTTALQIIRDGLSLTNAIGIDQTLTADESTDCLRVLNNTIEDFSTQNLAVYGQNNQTFTTVPGQKVYTIGPGGDWNTVRPERINDPAYTVINNVTFPCSSITQDKYNLIGFKDQQQQWPNFYLYVNTFPLGTVTLWPVPNAAVPITFSIDLILSQISAIGTTLTFPQGYAEAFTYCFGCKIAPVFGKRLTDYPDVVAEKNRLMGNIKRVNLANKKRVMNYDTALRQGTYWGRFYGGPW